MFGLTKILGGDHPPLCGYDPENLPFKKIQWDNLSTQHKSYTMFLEFRKALVKLLGPVSQRPTKYRRLYAIKSRS